MILRVKRMYRGKLDVDVTEVPKELEEYVLWCMAMEYKPGTIVDRVRRLKKNNGDGKNYEVAKRSYERYLIFKSELGFEVKEPERIIKEYNKKIGYEFASF